LSASEDPAIASPVLADPVLADPVLANPALANPPALAAWLDAAGLGVGAPLQSRFLSGGSQNEIFEITRGDLRAVLRVDGVPQQVQGARA
jgi:hypothetical protein